MTNLEWLEKVKADDDEIKENLGITTYSPYHINMRKTKALEIIAEELINIKEELRYANNKSF
jgi:hypothetical protein